MNDTSEQNNNIFHVKYKFVNKMQSYVALINKHAYLHSDRTIYIKLKLELQLKQEMKNMLQIMIHISRIRLGGFITLSQAAEHII